MNINRVVLTGNLTADPEVRPTPGGTPVARLRPGGQHPPAERFDRSVGGEAQLLRRHRVGSPGRELWPLPVQGTVGRGRRPARVAGVRGQGWEQTPGRRDHRRERAVPRTDVGRAGGASRARA